MANNDGGNIDPTGQAYQDILNQILTRGAGAGWNSTNANTTLQQYGTDFVQQFQNATGQAPTADQINQFYSQAVAPIINTQAGFSSTDPNAIVSQYVPQAFQSQIQQNDQNQISNLGTQIGNLATNVGTQTAQQLADPKSAAYQAFSGAENNLGITPSSGAFQQGEGAAVGNAASNTMQQLLTSLGGGAIAGSQSPSLSNLIGTGQQAEAGTTGYNQQLNNFNLESQLGQLLAGMSQPSGAQKDIGLAGAAGQALGGLGTGAAGLSQVTWICTAMRECGALSQIQVKILHDHLYKAFWKRPLKFIAYLLFGRFLVYLANKSGTNWHLWKDDFYEDVIAESDPVRAVDLYERKFWKLYANVKMNLDGRKLHAA